MSACCLFAFILMRLDDAAINRELREDFKMFIIEHDKKMLEIGRLDGLKEGRREGRQEGRREGRQEERYEMVMKMLVKEMPLSTISELSGLSELEIIALRDGPRKNKAV
jgi:predicted transposase/invertase (TIGR01784 family)